jgi:biopolymer transport protein ExbB
MDTVILLVLVLASVIALTFIIERGLALRTGKIIPPSVEEALENCHNTADLPMLRRICQQHPSPLSRLLLLADKHRNWPRAENASALETSARHEVAKMERGLVVLEIVVGVAPLMGLVGTIYGLISLFDAMGQNGLGDNNALAKGIALALNATLGGLLTAIPSLIAWSYYTKRVENFAIEMAALCDVFLRRQYHHDESEELAAEQIKD